LFIRAAYLRLFVQPRRGGGGRISGYLSKGFKLWCCDNHFYVAVFRTMFVNVLILAVAILR
jgi:hypothetical protein